MVFCNTQNTSAISDSKTDKSFQAPPSGEIMLMFIPRKRIPRQCTLILWLSWSDMANEVNTPALPRTVVLCTAQSGKLCSLVLLHIEERALKKTLQWLSECVGEHWRRLKTKLRLFAHVHPEANGLSVIAKDNWATKAFYRLPGLMCFHETLPFDRTQ